jgi:hypothetical protein
MHAFPICCQEKIKCFIQIHQVIVTENAMKLFRVEFIAM